MLSLKPPLIDFYFDFSLSFRQKESERARTQMAEIRQDPAYRESERQKDRERRRAARQRKDFRDRERERDREYKRSQRHVPEHNSVTSGPHCGEVYHEI